jgi:PAS domain S-box-containing protein
MDLGQAQAILERTHSAFVSMDEEGRITHWNTRAEELFGLPRADALGRPLADTIIPERHRDAHRRGLRSFKQTGVGPMLDRRVELSALRADGSELPVEATITALQAGGAWSFHAFLDDVSERRAAERERQRLSVIVNSLAEAITIRARDGHLIYANRAALDRLGVGSIEELRAADPRALLSGYEATDEHGRRIAFDDLPSVKLLRDAQQQPDPLLVRHVNRTTGEEQWSLLKATAVRDAEGAIDVAVTIIEDVTQARRSELRMEFLARAGETLASSLDYQQTLRNVAGLAVPQIADWCAVDLFDEGGEREPVAVAHADPGKLQMAERLRAFEPQQLDPERGLGRVRRTGEALLYPEIPDALLVEAAVDAEHLSRLRAVGMRSVLVVPLNVRGRTIGALTMVSAESARTFGQGDLEFAEQIAERAAHAVENARLYTERSRIARTLQRSLLPEALPEVPGWEIAALYRPAGQGNEVGGDFYDFWEVGGEWLLMVGDVTGKGVGAAAVTSLARHTAWTASEFDSRPAQILARVDAALKRQPTLSVCTALCLRLTRGRGTIASGGHPLPLRLAADGISEVGRHGTLLGAFDEISVSEAPIAMRPGQTLVIVTDGVTDAVGAGGERFGMGRLREVLAGGHELAPSEIRKRLVAALEDFQVGPQHDDTAVIVMRFSGAFPKRASVHERQALAGTRPGGKA